MNTMETIYARKSVRTYTGELITDEELNIILKAANELGVDVIFRQNYGVCFPKTFSNPV